MENTKITNIKKAALTTTKVLNVIRGILLAGIIICGIGALCCFAFKFGPDGKSIDILGKTINVYGPVDFTQGMDVHGFDFIEKLNIESITLKAGINCIVAMVMVGLAFAAVVIIRNLFKLIAESDTPFTEEIAKKIKITGIVVSVMVLTESLGIAAIVALSFWCFSTIFEYGVELQKLEDETL
ncbi:MAG: hypothetical protein IKR39_10440 [Lachnospiraceae bacterium]|nr:hypothetical protein [Lachnospiraceae bacterium]